MINPNNIQHVYPTNDLEEHLLEVEFPAIGLPRCMCKCKPKHIEVDNEGLVIVHDAFDGRVGVEIANEILRNV